MEHEIALQTEEQRENHRVWCEDVRQRLAQIAGDECQVRRYDQITRQWLDAAQVRALVLSGNVTDWPEYTPDSLREIIVIVRQAARPVLGLCGGLQLIALAYDVPVGPMRPLAPGERDPDPEMGGGYFKEWGFTPVRVTRSDPLFDGLSEAPIFLAAHYAESKGTPPGFELLASTDACRVQAIRQTGKPVYGVQFHPEAYTETPDDRRSWLVRTVYPQGYPQAQPDGRTLLTNFFRIAGIPKATYRD